MRWLKSCVGIVICTVVYAGSAAGLQWNSPPGWQKEPGARPMRVETYSIPPAAGEPNEAECVIYFFGANEGGPVEANMRRWEGQFRAPDGSAPHATIQKKQIHGLTATTIDVSGDYSGMGGPMAAHKTVKHGYRLLGAILEGPGGNIFVKFTGPSKTVAANRAKFDAMLNSFQKASR